MTEISKRDQLETLGSRASLQQPLRSYEWQDSLSIRRMVDKLLKRKHYVFIVFLMVLVPAAVATFLMTPLYRSWALVQMNPDPVEVLPYRDVADSSGRGTTYEDYMGTQQQLLTGPSLRSRVLRRLDADFQDDPVVLGEKANLVDRFAVRKIERSQLFELSYRAPSPEAAATIVNLFAEEHVKQNFEMRQGTRIKAEQDLKKELESLEGRLQLSEQDLMTYAQQYDIMSLEQGQVDPLQERLSALNQQAADAESAVTVAKASFDSLQSASIAEFPQRLVSEQVGQLDSRMLELEQELTTLRSSFGENWPAVIEKRNEMALIREQLVREKTAVLARHREQAQLDLASAEARHNMSTRALDEQKSLVNRFHDASIQYNILKRDVDTNRNLYDGLLQRLRQTGVMAGFQFGNIQVVEPGRPSRLVDSPKVALNLAIAALLGLALGVVVVILLDSWDNSISTMEEAEQLTPIPSLGSVPLMKIAVPSQAMLTAGSTGSPAGNGLAQLIRRSSWFAAREPSLPRASQNGSLPFEVTESIRSICASILLSRSDERPRVIVVTSATHAEGKTTIVTHLGKAFADAGLSTLLVEADLRKPDLSRSFSIGNEDGLSLYLAGHVTPWPKIHQTDVPNLFLAAGGPVPPNPAALLHSEKLGAFLKAAASDYQVVILDAPPLLPIADARILGIQADGVVLVIRAGRTAKNLIGRASALLEGSGANVLGMVLNGWEPERAEMQHYRYYPHA